jgi:hypothetical protein
MSSDDNRGDERHIFVTRGSDYTFDLEFRDENNVIRNITQLIVWLEGIDGGGFTFENTDTGKFTVTLPHAVTSALGSVTAYSIGYIDESSNYTSALYGFVRIPPGQLGAVT